MSYRRTDQIYDILDNLRENLRSVDGSKTMGYVNPEMEQEVKIICSKILALETEAEEIQAGWLSNEPLQTIRGH